MTNPRITPEAENDIDEILQYIAVDNFDAAVSFYDRMQSTFETLAASPRAGRERSDLSEGLRCFPIGNYLIFYRVWARETVAITRVIHSARDIEEIFS